MKQNPVQKNMEKFNRPSTHRALKKDESEKIAQEELEYYRELWYTNGTLSETTEAEEK